MNGRSSRMKDNVRLDNSVVTQRFTGGARGMHLKRTPMQDRNESCLLSMRAGASNLFAGSTREVE